MFDQRTLFVFAVIFASFWNFSKAEFTEEQQELINNLHNECTGQTGVAKNPSFKRKLDGFQKLITNAQKGDFADDPKLKCYIKCIFDEIGMINDDGKLDIEGMVAMLPDELKEAAEPVFKKCGTKPGSDLCDSIWQTHKCYYAENPKAYFYPEEKRQSLQFIDQLISRK